MNDLHVMGALVLMVGGCASSYSEPVMSADHPANPDAMEAPAREALGTLAVSGTSRAGEAPAEHAGHAMKGEPVPGTPREPASEAAPAAGVFACPMHPEVTGERPDQRCPKCGMKLVPVLKKEGTR